MSGVPDWVREHEDDEIRKGEKPDDDEICPVTGTTTCTKDPRKQRACSKC